MVIIAIGIAIIIMQLGLPVPAEENWVVRADGKMDKAKARTILQENQLEDLRLR